ncbi:hypothetical protein ACVIEM_003812 [Rhizobium leguminosarum]
MLYLLVFAHSGRKTTGHFYWNCSNQMAISSIWAFAHSKASST